MSVIWERIIWYEADLYTWLNRNLNINHHHDVTTVNSECFQQPISNVLEKPQQHYNLHSCQMTWLLENSYLTDISNWKLLTGDEEKFSRM